MFKAVYLALKLWLRNNPTVSIKQVIETTPRECDDPDCKDLTINYTILPNNIIRCRECTQKYWGSK